MKRCQRLVLVAVAASLATASAASAQVSQMAGVRTQVPFALGPFELTTAGTVDRIASPVGARTPFNFDATLALPIKSFGFWVGSGLEGAPEVDSTPQRALYRFGLWQSYRNIRVTIGAASRIARVGGGVDWSRQISPIRAESVFVIDTLGGGRPILLRVNTADTTNRSDTTGSRVAQWADLEGRISWRLGRASFDASVGSRPGIKQSRVTTDSGHFQSDTGRHAPTATGTTLRGAFWTRLGVNYLVSNHLSVTAAVGNDPARLALGVPGTRFASVSLRLNPWRAPKTDPSFERPTTFVVMPAGSGNYRITYAVPNAASVELSGDFDKWRPVSLVQTRKGVWETTLTIAPGTYHINVRVNGDKWVAPTGLPQAKDDFNGTVGVLVVR